MLNLSKFDGSYIQINVQNTTYIKIMYFNNGNTGSALSLAKRACFNGQSVSMKGYFNKSYIFYSIFKQIATVDTNILI